MPETSKPALKEGRRYDAVLAGGGEMGQLMRSTDWSQTALGAPETWPESFRSALSICLNTQFPIALYWGSELALVYNDAWRPIVGNKHPWSMGRAGIEVWPEIRDTIEPLWKQVFRTGEGVFSQDQLLPMHRHGYTEECYFDFTFSPIKNQDGTVGGIFNAVQETTYRVINERRSRLLQEIASTTSSARDADKACRLATEAFRTNPEDLPFAILYLADTDTRQCHLAAMTGLAANHPAIPKTILLDTHTPDTDPWHIAQVMRSACADHLRNLADWVDGLPEAPWQEAPQEALVLPIVNAGLDSPLGVLVAGVSARRALDEHYRIFYEQIAGQVAMAVVNARAYEEERKRAEALAKLDLAKTTFFSNVSHEFRTPLTLLMGPIEEVLNNPGTTPENRQHMDVAHRNALRLLKLVNTLLDFSRFEAGRLEASYRATDLSALTSALASMFQTAIDKAGLRLTVECPPLPEPVYVDRDMWEKIVLNLISNAFKHTFEGEIRVNLSWQPDTVSLTVQDTGIGIPEDQQGKLFDRFHRVPNVRSRTHEGSGIGLALVQELVTLHGGTVTVSSVLQQGSTFTVTLPTGKTHLPAERIDADSTLASTELGAKPFIEEALRWLPESGPGDFMPDSVSDNIGEPDLTPSDKFWRSTAPGREQQKARILLADDNADMRDYVRRLLAVYCDVEVAPDGQIAWEAARRNPPDLIVSDVMMPNRNGFELLEALRADARLQAIPVILLSARAGEEAKLEGLQAGADDYLVKPFSAKELTTRVRTNLELHRVRQEAAETQREGRERLQAALNAARTGTFRWNIQTNELFLDENLDRLFGLPPGQTAQTLDSFIALVHPDDRQAVIDRCTQCKQNAADFDMTFQVIWPDGSIHWLHDKGKTYLDLQGKPLYMTGACLDITERKRMELILQGQKQALEQAVHGKPLHVVLATIARTVEEQSDHTLIASILLLDADGKHLRHGAAPSLPQLYNDAIDGLEIGPGVGSCGTAAYTGQEVVVTDIKTDPLWADFKHLALPNQLQACWSTPILSSKDTLLGTFALYYPKVQEPSPNDREVVDLMLRTAGIVIEWHQDILERKQAEIQLRQSEERYRLAMSASEMMGTFDWRIQDDRIYSDERFATMFSMSPEQGKQGTPIADYFHAIHTDDVAHVQKAVQHTIDTGEKYSVEYRLCQADDSIRWIIVYGECLYDDAGKPWRFPGVAIDITERKLAEEELQKLAHHLQVSERATRMYASRLERSNKELESFATIASHDLQAPLRKVQMFTSHLQMLTRGKLDADAMDYIERTQRAAERMQHLISDLLALSRVTRAGKSFKKIELTPLLQEVVDDLRLDIKDANGTVTFATQCAVDADETQIRQLFQNLIQNALKFHRPEVPPVITIKADILDGEYCDITVKDNGIGIKAEHAERIFEVFQRLHSENTYPGNGIGLSICKKIIERHGGTIQAHGEPGQGTRFHIRLPKQQEAKHPEPNA